MTINYIQVFGERCTGTNWLTRLIRDNFDVPAGDGVFGKHNWIEPQHIRDDVLYIHITKDVYSWALSMATHRHHQVHTCDMGFSQYIREEWACFDNSGEMMFERDPKTGRRFINIIDMFNAKMSNWLRFNENFMHIPYDLLLRDTECYIDFISAQWDLQLKNSITTITKKYKGQDFSTNFSRYNYYINKEYLKEISPEDFAFIHKHLDMDTYYSYGYTIENHPVS